MRVSPLFFMAKRTMYTKKNKNKRQTQGHIKNYTDNTAPRKDENGERFTDAYDGMFQIPFPRARFGVESKGFVGDIFEPTDGDAIDEN